jgi:NAD(P)H-hydrate repair Nnr-like enzyme with NAD(P)H-hydrate dehydratase domain
MTSSDVNIPEPIKKRAGAFLVGPGLSRDPNILDQTLSLLNQLAELKRPIIIDGVLL